MAEISVGTPGQDVSTKRLGERPPKHRSAERAGGPGLVQQLPRLRFLPTCGMPTGMPCSPAFGWPYEPDAVCSQAILGAGECADLNDLSRSVVVLALIRYFRSSAGSPTTPRWIRVWPPAYSTHRAAAHRRPVSFAWARQQQRNSLPC